MTVQGHKFCRPGEGETRQIRRVFSLQSKMYALSARRRGSESTAPEIDSDAKQKL